MAKILSIVGTLSGSIAGTTYSHNKGGPYIRRRAVPTIAASPKQSFAKAVLADVSSSWNSLTSAERAAWGDWAALNPVIDTLGQSIQLSGQQAYISLNCRLQGAAQPLITSPPVDDGPPQLLTLTVTPTAPSSLSVAFTPALPTGFMLALWMTLPTTAGRNPNVNQARLVAYSDPDQVSPFVVTTPYSFSAGNQVNFFATILDTSGRVAPRIMEQKAIP